MCTNKLEKLRWSASVSRKTQTTKNDSRRNTQSKRSITSKDTELAIKKLSKKKSLESDGFTGEFYHTFKEESISVFHKFLPPKIKEVGTLSNLFYDAVFPWHQNQTKILQEHHTPYLLWVNTQKSSVI